MMTDLVVFHCPTCEMGFRSRRLLEKHVEKFCIGKETTIAVDARHRNRQTPCQGKEPKKTETPDSMYHQLQEPRAKRHHLREWQDGEYEQQAYHLKSLDLTGSVSDSQALKKLTKEFHKLRMSLEDTHPTFRTFRAEDNDHRILHQQEYWQRQQQMVEAHERQLADIQARNQYLEQQKNEIHRNLSELKRGNSAISHIEQLLMDLNGQERKNQLALDALREQVELLQAATKSRSKSGPPVNMKIDNVVDKTEEKVSFKSLPFPAPVGPLSSEIQALYLAYLQGGGSDHNIISQMYELQVEATALETAGARPEYKGRKKKHKGSPSTYRQGLDAELLTLELENQRLEDEIFKMKILRDRRRTEDGSLDKELAELQRAHMAEMAQLHDEIRQLRYNTERMKPQRPRRGASPIMPPPIAPPLPPPPPHHLLGLPDPTFPASNMHFLDPAEALGPAPYDPASGFVIFYDFLLGLDLTVYQIRLISGLYRNGQELGKSTPLPIVSSDMGQSPQYAMDGRRGCCAILAARQPVPRILPSTSISLITELQASGGFDAYGLEIQNLVPRGWTKINIFDHLHQVMSGHWKVPVRVLPMKPGLTAEQLNGVPQVGKAELFLRLVNARDADMQSMAEIHPGNAPLYKYAPTVSRTPW
ncbi:hypothetical protein lerEdw1_018676 [Lerista edwardsae]|nr:hypothetical protein lerEdw1_018676 [Lerista edwardsae]